MDKTNQRGTSDKAKATAPKRVTLKDIAGVLDISHVTVSMALRNHPRISETTKLRVQEKAREMGYFPDPMLTALANYRRASKKKPIQSGIAWLNLWKEPEKLRSFRQFDLYWKGAKKTAEEQGFRLEEFALKDIPVQKLASILKARNIPGLLIPPTGHPLQFDVSSIPWNDFSIVQFGINSGLPAFHAVTSNQVTNTEMAFDRIRAMGYRRIGFCGYQTRLRIFGAGFYWAQCGIPEKDRVSLLDLYPGDYDRQFAQLKAWIKKEKPDAILIDELDRYDIRKMLQDIGHRVPEDIGLATTNVLDTDINAGINQNPEEIGKTAMHALIAQINNRQKGAPTVDHHTLVAGRWVDGDMLPNRT